METTALQPSISSSVLRRKMMGEKKFLKKNLKTMGVVITQMTKIDLSEHDGLFFQIFSIGNSHEKMCEFHENDLGKILLFFYAFNPTTGK